MNLLYRICSRHEILLKLALSTNQSIMHMPSSGVWICHVSDKNNPFSNLQRFFSVCDYHLVWFMRVPLAEQELPTLPEHLSSPPVLSGVRVTRSLVSCMCFVDRCLSFCTFSFGHCIVCSSSIYGFGLPIWYLQALHTHVLLYFINTCFN